ncbi:hypothetical protein PUR21_31070 [Methylorubrum rhodesianum]|uniref:Uncharacterized protein n=1 Tax=Methylorubrum rhodesianum TaxID=29427 RepID=A0ABU9ZKL5_9HYPH
MADTAIAVEQERSMPSALDRVKKLLVEEQVKPKAPAKVVDKVSLRRNKFTEYLNGQISLVNPARPIKNQAAGKKKPKPIRPSYWTNEQGKIVLVLRYGTSPVIIDKNKPHFVVADNKQLEEVLDALVEATSAGELDPQLEQASRKKVGGEEAAS